MKWPKRKPGFKDEVLWKLDVLRGLYTKLDNRADRKEFKRAWKEPAKWQLTKLPDGKWRFEWDVGPSSHGQATGDFNYCLECMARFEGVAMQVTKKPAAPAPQPSCFGEFRDCSKPACELAEDCHATEDYYVHEDEPAPAAPDNTKKFKVVNFVCSGCEKTCAIPCSVQMQSGIHADPSRCVVNGEIVDWLDKMKPAAPRHREPSPEPEKKEGDSP